MRRWNSGRLGSTVAVLAAFEAAALLAAQAAGAPKPASGASPWVVRQVTQEAAHRQDAQFAYPYATWRVPRRNEGAADLFLCDLRTGATKQIASDALSQCRIHGNFVSYTNKPGWQLYDIAAGELTKIMDKPPGNNMTPAFGGNIVAWDMSIGHPGGGSSSRVFMYDIPAKRLTQVPHDGAERDSLATDGRTLVWSEQTKFGAPAHVWAFDIATAAMMQLTDDPAWSHKYPLVSGNHVVWLRQTIDQRSSDGVYLYDLTTGSTKRVSHENGSVLLRHHWDGTRIVWDGAADAAAPHPAHVFQHDITTGTTTQLTAGNSPGHNPRVGGKLVCWPGTAEGAQDTDIFLHDGKRVHCLRNEGFNEIIGRIESGFVMFSGMQRVEHYKRGDPLNIQIFLAEMKQGAKQKASRTATTKSTKPKAAGTKTGKKNAGGKRGKITVGRPKADKAAK